MREKIPSEIIQLALSDASYEGCGVSITPTLINFFFGNNGTGKSTVARTIKAGAGVTLRSRILTDNKDKFIKVDETGKEDYTLYQMAHAMLSYISANSVGLNDGINFVDDCVDVEQTKETFRMIFTLMEQKQHYDMMMGNQ